MNTKELKNVIPERKDMFSVELQYTIGENVLHFEFVDAYAARVYEKTIPILPSENPDLNIPEAEYDAVVQMPSGEFERSIRNLQALGGDEIQITVGKDDVKFSTEATRCSATVLCKHSSSIDNVCCFLFQLLLFVRLSFFFCFVLGCIAGRQCKYYRFQKYESILEL